MVLRLTFDKLGCISTIKISELRIAILIFAILVLSSIYTNVWCKRQINDYLLLLDHSLRGVEARRAV